MSDDWKHKIDEQEAKARQDQLQQVQRDHEKQLNEHKAKFSCHVCSKPSEGPSKTYGRGGSRDDWEKPTGLWQCIRCQKWACGQHIYKNICMNCAKRL